MTGSSPTHFPLSDVGTLRRQHACHDLDSAAAFGKLDAATPEQLRAPLHQSPRTFGRPCGSWTFALAAEICWEQNLTPYRVNIEDQATSPQTDRYALAAGQILDHQL
jgi:hypothetical protein